MRYSKVQFLTRHYAFFEAPIENIIAEHVCSAPSR